MPTEQQQLEDVIAGLEAQRALLGDAVVDAAIVPLRARLAALLGQTGQQLKQVTVLFADIVGSTAMGRQCDPEEVHAIVDGALERFATRVKEHKGRILQYTGDGMLAAFGADEVQEDDAERAVCAGLALLNEASRYAAAVEQRYGLAGFSIRVGVHTGPVLLGGGVYAEGSIRGSTVNAAARLQEAAPPGAMRISHDTFSHVRGMFDVEVQPPIEVKGLEKPLVTYLVRQARPRAFRVMTRGIEGVETRMVGRDAELEALQEAFKALHIHGAALRVVTTVGEAGIGKSRLLHEFRNWAAARPERVCLFQGRAMPQTRSQPYGLLRDILAWWLQIADSDSMDAAKEKLDQGAVPLFETHDSRDMAQAHAHLLGQLIGLDFTESPHVTGIRDDARQIRNRGFHAAAQIFRRVTAREGAPVVLLLDDLHGSDDGSLDFLNYLVQVNRDVPMLLLVFTRPTLFERRPDWPGTTPAQRIELSPLDRGASRLLANELLKKVGEIPAALRELIIGGGEGIPFYMEELVKMLVDQGAIEIGPERWNLHPERLLATNVPQTLTGVLQARLDGLKPAEKLALQQASVIGFVFWDLALAAIDPAATESLRSLIQRDLVIPHQDTSLDGAREFAFKHQILHHVTYDTVLKRTRRECHARAASWLAGLTGARARDFLGATAEHYERAGDDAQAAEFFARAAEQAAERYSHEAALGYVASALALMGADDESGDRRQRWRLLDVRERTLGALGRRADQQDAIDTLQRLADALSDDTLRAKVAWRRSYIATRTGDFRTAAHAARQALALAEPVGALELRLDAQRFLAIALAHLGDADGGRRLALDGLDVARAHGLRRVEGGFVNTLSVVADRQHDVITTLEMTRQWLEIERELGNRQNEAVGLSNLGFAWLDLGEYAQARDNLDAGLKLARAVGHRTIEPYPLTGLSRLALWQGDDALALAYAQSALDIASAVHDRYIEARALARIGNAELALDRHAAAATAFGRAHDVAVAMDDVFRYDAAAGLARVALAQGDVAEALRAVEGLLAHVGGGGTLAGTDSPGLIRVTCYQVLCRAGDPRAADQLSTAHAELLASAAAIANDTLRQSFLHNIPEHREIVAAWAAIPTPSETPPHGGSCTRRE